MATVTPYLDTRTKRKSGLYPVVIIVNHEKKQKFIPTGWKIDPRYWAKNRVKNHGQAEVINAKISSIVEEADNYIAECMLRSRPIRIELIGTGKSSHLFPDFILFKAKQFEEDERIIMSKKFERLAKELSAMQPDVTFSEINEEKLRALEKKMIENGNAQNTRHGKFKMLGEIYGQAIKAGKADPPNPFHSVKIKKQPVRKEKLTKEEIESIEKIEAFNDTDISRDMFLFSYYSKGIRFENCLFFKRADIVDGRLIIRANKGGKFITVKIHPRLQGIIDKYPQGPFLFPFVKSEPITAKQKVSVKGTYNTIVNRNLKVVAALAGIKKALTFHIARHSFAYQMKGVTDSIHVIKDSLGHSKTSTTEEYLESLMDERLDKEVGKLYGG